VTLLAGNGYVMEGAMVFTEMREKNANGYTSVVLLDQFTIEFACWLPLLDNTFYVRKSCQINVIASCIELRF
jgi:hypothetical protein